MTIDEIIERAVARAKQLCTTCEYDCDGPCIRAAATRAVLAVVEECAKVVEQSERGEGDGYIHSGRSRKSFATEIRALAARPEGRS